MLLSTSEVIALAYKHAHACENEGRKSNALVCLHDAEALAHSGSMDYARQRALKSLSYSVGVFHPDHHNATL